MSYGDSHGALRSAEELAHQAEVLLRKSLAEQRKNVLDGAPPVGAHAERVREVSSFVTRTLLVESF